MRPLSVSEAKRERLQERQHLRHDEHAMPIPAIDVDAGERREKQRGDLAEEADQAEQKSGIGQPVDEPAGGDPRDPRADERNALTEKEEPVVAASEGAEQDAEVRQVRRVRRCTDRWSGACLRASRCVHR